MFSDEDNGDDDDEDDDEDDNDDDDDDDDDNDDDDDDDDTNGDGDDDGYLIDLAKLHMRDLDYKQGDSNVWSNSKYIAHGLTNYLCLI